MLGNTSHPGAFPKNRLLPVYGVLGSALLGTGFVLRSYYPTQHHIVVDPSNPAAID
jgi:hypothetical protein